MIFVGWLWYVYFMFVVKCYFFVGWENGYECVLILIFIGDDVMCCEL